MGIECNTRLAYSWHLCVLCDLKKISELWLPTYHNKTLEGTSLTQVDCRPVERTWVITGSTFSPFDTEGEENKTIRRVSERSSMCEEALSPSWPRQFCSAVFSHFGKREAYLNSQVMLSCIDHPPRTCSFACCMITQLFHGNTSPNLPL